MVVVVGGLGVSSLGSMVAGSTGIPVYNWARSVASGTAPLQELATRSQSLAALSQTSILLVGLGGFPVAMSVLGVTAVVRGGTPRWVLAGADSTT